MGRSQIDVLLDQCVADVKAGRRTAAQCLADHADARAELEPLLRIALAVVPPAVVPDPTRKARARHAFVAALHGEKWGETRGKKRRPWWVQGLFGALPRLSVPALSALAVAALVLTTGGAAFAAQEAQPGEVLYGVKLAIEQVQVATATSDEARAQVYLDLAARRLAEVERAFDSNNPAAARLAAEAHAQALADAEAHLEMAESQGRPVDTALARLEANIQRQQGALQKAAARADEAAQAPIERARERAQRGLERAKERTRERGKEAGAAAATPAGSERGAGVGRAGAPAELPPVRAGAGAAATATAAARAAAPLTATALTAAGLQQLAAQVEALAGESRVPGESYRGLRAKLEAAEAALARGQARAARNQLDALRRELEAMHRAGHIGDGSYAALQASIAALAETLAAADDRPAASQGRERGREDAPESEGRPEREAGPREAPAQPPGQRGRGERGQGDAPPGAGATRPPVVTPRVATPVATPMLGSEPRQGRGHGEGRDAGPRDQDDDRGAEPPSSGERDAGRRGRPGGRP